MMDSPSSSPDPVGWVDSEHLVINDNEEEVSLLDTVGGTDFAMSTEQLLDDIEADELGREHPPCEDEDEGSTYEQDDEAGEQRGPRKKKVKNRHVKAAIMIAVIWTIMVGFLVVSLSAEWWNKAWNNLSDLCTLCGTNSTFHSGEVELTEWPTRKPSSMGASSLFSMLDKAKTLRPPPDNIAQVCSPSIYLDHGSDYIGPSVNDLVAVCANACFPATCCIVNDEEAKLGLISTLESQGLGSQASVYLSSVENCYTDDNIAICDEYGKFCQTIYRLNANLDNAISEEMNTMCRWNNTTPPRTKSYNDLRTSCSICNSLSCCYDTAENTTGVAVERKRKRQHDESFNAESRRLSSQSCEHFTTEDGSLNARVCHAYGPYCNPLHSLQSTISIPSIARPMIPAVNSSLSLNSSDFNDTSSPTIALPSYNPTISTTPSLVTTNSPFYTSLTSENSMQPTQSPANITLQYLSAPSHAPFQPIGNQSLTPSSLVPSETPINDSNVNLTSSFIPSQQTSPSPSAASSEIPTSSTNVNDTRSNSPSPVYSLTPSLSFAPSSKSPVGTTQIPTVNPNIRK